MAKIQEQYIVISMSKLVKNNAIDNEMVSADTLANIETIVQELVGDSIIVEVQDGANDE